MRAVVTRWLAVVTLGLVLAGCGGAPSEAESAARAGYLAQNPGKSLGQVERSGEQDGCALLDFSAPGGLVKLVVKRDSGHWTYLRPVDSPDLDDSNWPDLCAH